MLPMVKKLSFLEVPVVDMALAFSGSEDGMRRVAQEIGAACSLAGFFYVKNHGISTEDVEAIFRTAKEFHDLPLEDKLEVSVTKNNHFQGYLDYMSKGNDCSISENLQEVFQIRRPLAESDPDLHSGKPLHGKIPWPTAMPNLQSQMMAYYDRMDELGQKLLVLFAMSLDLPRHTFQRFFQKDMNMLRLLHFPPQAPESSSLHLGQRAHTDSNAFTILAQDMNGGLEVRNRDGEWIAVPPISNTFVINVGEVLKVWTDAIFPSAAHRVINRSGNARYSIPYFFYPTFDEVIYPILRNPDPDNVAPEDLPNSMPRGRPFVWGELKAKHSASIIPQMK